MEAHNDNVTSPQTSTVHEHNNSIKPFLRVDMESMADVQPAKVVQDDPNKFKTNDEVSN
jgi:hypothetical protein